MISRPWQRRKSLGASHYVETVLIFQFTDRNRSNRFLAVRLFWKVCWKLSLDFAPLTIPIVFKQLVFVPSRYILSAPELCLPHHLTNSHVSPTVIFLNSEPPNQWGHYLSLRSSNISNIFLSSLSLVYRMYFYLFVYVCICVVVCFMCAGVLERQKRVWGPLELELQALMSLMWMLGT